MELWRYYRILRRRKWLIIIGTLICVGIVFTATRLTGDKWEAYTTVMEKPPGDDGKVSIYAGQYYQFDPQMRLANLAQLVKSQTVMQNTWEKLQELEISTEPTEILKTLDVTPLLNTTLLLIRVQSDSNAEAQATADVVALEFVKFYNELNSSGASRSKAFIETELPKAEARLNKIRDEMRQFKEESGAVLLAQQTQALIQRMSQLEQTATQHSIAAQQASARVQGLDERMSEFPEMREGSRTVAMNPLWQQLQNDLTKLEIELQRMLETRTPEHPDVKELQKQVNETRGKLDNTASTILANTVETKDPIRDNLTQNLVAAMVDQASAQAAANAAQQSLDRLQPELEELPAKEMRLAQMNLDQEAAMNTYYLLRQKYDEATIKENEAENISTIQIVDRAQVRKADPHKTLKLILALVLSPIFCAGIAFLLNYLDNTVKTPEEAESLLQLPVFSVVPIAKHPSLADGKHLPAIGNSYQMLSSNLAVGHPDADTRTILVASAEPDVGRSLTASNLAIALARDGSRVILVDGDMRQPSQHELFGVDNEKGLSNVLAGQLPLPDALQPTSIPDLLLVPSGPLPANPVRLLRSSEMAKFVRTINDMADFVIFDSPAGITFSDATILAAMVKNVVIVYAAGSVPRGAEAEFRNRLEQVDANMLGVVLNMVNPEDSHGYYHFRSAYEELMRDGKSTAALSGRKVSAMTEDSDSVESDKT